MHQVRHLYLFQINTNNHIIVEYGNVTAALNGGGVDYSAAPQFATDVYGAAPNMESNYGAAPPLHSEYGGD